MNVHTQADVARIVSEAASSVSVWEFQQDHDELASLLWYVANNGRQPMRYLEIGAGSGMVAKTIDSVMHFATMHVIDNNYYDFAQSDRADRLPDATEWVGDSSSAACRDAVQQWDMEFDFVLIDGGHTYRECKSDTLLVLPHLAEGAYVAFHDKNWAYTEPGGDPDAGVKGWLAELHDGAVPGLDEEPWQSGNTALYRYTRTP